MPVSPVQGNKETDLILNFAGHWTGASLDKLPLTRRTVQGGAVFAGRERALF